MVSSEPDEESITLKEPPLDPVTRSKSQFKANKSARGMGVAVKFVANSVPFLVELSTPKFVISFECALISVFDK